VLGPERPGTRLVHIGDVGEVDNLIPVVRNADAMVIEATYLYEDLAMAQEFGHLTAYQAAQLAARAGVKNLILTHVSRRYRERDIAAEARSVFPNTVVARDFDAFQIKREECIKVKIAAEEE
jgi:ribonuclease Z